MWGLVYNVILGKWSVAGASYMHAVFNMRTEVAEPAFLYSVTLRLNFPCTDMVN